MKIEVDMQGWYAVIRGGELVAAFPNYEEALVYRRTIQKEGDDILIERIEHRKS